VSQLFINSSSLFGIIRGGLTISPTSSITAFMIPVSSFISQFFKLKPKSIPIKRIINMSIIVSMVIFNLVSPSYPFFLGKLNNNLINKKKEKNSSVKNYLLWFYTESDI